jgi:hypothetical protein
MVLPRLPLPSAHQFASGLAPNLCPELMFLGCIPGEESATPHCQPFPTELRAKPRKQGNLPGG